MRRKAAARRVNRRVSCSIGEKGFDVLKSESSLRHGARRALWRHTCSATGVLELEKIKRIELSDEEELTKKQKEIPDKLGLCA